MARVKATGAERRGADFAARPQPAKPMSAARRARNFASPGGFMRGQPATYRCPIGLALNAMGLCRPLDGRASNAAGSSMPGGSIAFRFQARDLHLVLGSPDGKPIRFRVTLDGKAPGADHGMDIDAAGNGQVTDHRLYQLVRQKDGAASGLFTITFLDPGRRSLRLHLRLKRGPRIPRTARCRRSPCA